MPDFTLKIYKQLLAALRDAGYRFITFEEYLRKTEDGRRKTEESRQKVEAQIADFASHQDHPSPITHHPSPIVILRHDVDLLPQNALAFARIQHEIGIRGSYYFRAVPESWDEDIIKEIHRLGHEVGYHYEDMDLAGRNTENGKRKTEKKETAETERRNENFQEIKEKEKTKREHNHSGKAFGLPSPVSRLPNSQTNLAIESFQRNLEKLRHLVPVSTICMHGSPRSRYDNRDLWKIYDYRDFGILGEPYFDVDFNEMFYLTDTGRRWDGWKVSVRDKVPQQETWIKQGLVFRSTHDIIAALKTAKPSKHEREERKETLANLAPSSRPLRLKKQPPVLPASIMFTFHPQRWTDKPLPWFKEWVMQSVKNKVKYFINLRREK